MERTAFDRLSRRELLKYGGAALAVGYAGLGSMPVSARSLAAARAFGGAQAVGCGVGGEPYPTSPLLLSPFSDALPIPSALAPSNPLDWKDENGTTVAAPYQIPSQQDSTNATHQIWPTQMGLPEPLHYRIRVQVNQHAFTTSRVQPIDAGGNLVLAPGQGAFGPLILPQSTIYGFNGTFPGPMINAEYGRPVCVRFENNLHLNPLGLDRHDFGSPEWGFLTHLHNGHTAPESDGNPNYLMNALGQAGYMPGQWVDNMYLNWSCDNDPSEKQSFFWFHDHFMHHTGANVYKGMVGLFPIYDPILDSGDETNTKALRLPGVRTNRPDGAFDVAYDIPMALYDCALDDGTTPHQDEHNGCGEIHPEWWGKTFFRHYPNHGFVGDIFTVNGTAYPVLEVKRRKYRFRFLDASIARIYNLSLMSSVAKPVASKDLGHTGVKLQGQYQLPGGQQCMQMTQIASEGGLLPFPIIRNSFELWPAKRREFVVDFTKYMDGTPTTKGDVIYLVNTLQMTNGRKPTAAFLDDVNGNPTTIPNPEFDPNFRVPMLKIVIGDAPPVPDKSVMPSLKQQLRPAVKLPSTFKGVPTRQFTLERGGGGLGPENQWVINGLPFDPLAPLAKPKKGSAELWTIKNGGGGWVHPMHLHMEEHHVISRNGKAAPDARHPEDTGKEDVVALDPGETVVIYRKFRTFTGKYVAHCHNLAHEDHNMMFGWEIVP
ncbi:MAG: multicopper oxidase domain-containing protein [Acidobacteriota bacterium]